MYRDPSGLTFLVVNIYWQMLVHSLKSLPEGEKHLFSMERDWRSWVTLTAHLVHFFALFGFSNHVLFLLLFFLKVNRYYSESRVWSISYVFCYTSLH